ncbi:biotin transporter BioY [Clostridium paraputrificum]|uniref:biotin transporter BioY n=1 Tax=Clostridium TaxID=1485 RepID=UPI003D34891F
MKLNLSIKETVLVGMCAALMGIFSQLSIPLPTVPLTLQVFGVVVIAVVVEGKIGGLSMIIFALLGAIGIPVFANFTAGIGVIAGGTGGFITGFIIMAFIIGWASSKNDKRILFLGAYIGLAIDYIIGVLQLKVVMGLSMQGALAAGCYPFIVKDIIMVSLGVIVALAIKNTIRGVIRIDARA